MMADAVNKFPFAYYSNGENKGRSGFYHSLSNDEGSPKQVRGTPK